MRAQTQTVIEDQPLYSFGVTSPTDTVLAITDPNPFSPRETPYLQLSPADAKQSWKRLPRMFRFYWFFYTGPSPTYSRLINVILFGLKICEFLNETRKKFSETFHTQSPSQDNFWGIFRSQEICTC